jgi:hypothetical protein
MACSSKHFPSAGAQLRKDFKGAATGQVQRTAYYGSCSETRFVIKPIHDYNFLVGGNYYLHVDILAGYDIGSWCNCRDRLHGNK